MKKSGVQKPKNPGPDFPVGTEVLFIRPHIDSGCVGVVERVEGGVHRLKIDGKNGAVYHTEATADVMRAWPWGDVVKYENPAILAR